MKQRIIILGDTHTNFFEDIPTPIIKFCKKVDLIIHLGDYITEDVLMGFKSLKDYNFKGVYGNADPLIMRKTLKPKEILEISNIRIGITHPYFGGSDFMLESKILKLFHNDNVQIIAYGHTHNPIIYRKNHILFINPGKAYIDNRSINPKASIVLLKIGNRTMTKLIYFD